ncbi:hypothetical protein ABIC09_006432 [Bradyrhizobium sp. S3.12.5]
MPEYLEDLQMLRLIKSFRKIKDPEVRRLILRFIEEKLTETMKVKEQS